MCLQLFSLVLILTWSSSFAQELDYVFSKDYFGSGGMSVISNDKGTFAAGAFQSSYYNRLQRINENTGMASWYKDIGAEPRRLAVDDEGNVYTVGVLRGLVDVDPSPATYNLYSSLNAVYLGKYSNSGDFIWGFVLESPGLTSFGQDIYIEDSVITISGKINADTDFDPGTGTFNLSSVTDKCFLAQYTTSGNFISAVNFGGNSIPLTLTKTNNRIIVTGDISGTGDFDPGIGTTILTSVDYADGFVASFNDTLGLHWAQTIGSQNAATSNSVSADSGGNIYCSGTFSGSFDANPGTGISILNSKGLGDVFVIKYDQFGQFIWAQSYGGTDGDAGASIEIGSDDNVYVSGTFQNTVDFDFGSGIAELTSRGDKDIFILKIDDQGDYIYAIDAGGSQGETIGQMSLNQYNEVFVTGSYRVNGYFDPDSGSPTISVGPGQGTNAYIVKYSSECTSTPPTIQAIFDPVCEGDSAVLTISGGALGNANNWKWSDGVCNGASISTNDTIVFYTNTSTNLYVQGVTGCIQSNNCSSISVNIPTMNVSANASAVSICSGDSIILYGSGADSYTWDNGVVDSTYFQPLVSSNFIVIGTNTNGCEDTAVMNVVVNELPIVEGFASDTVPCEGDSIILYGSGASTYSWDGGISNNIAFTASASYLYSVIAIDSNGCSSMDQINIVVNSLPQLSISASDLEFCDGELVTLTCSGANTYNWDNGITNGVPFIAIPNLLTVTGVDLNGCLDTAQITLTVFSSPNVFISTPDSEFCVSESSQFFVGTPVGGTFSGSGLTSGTSNPATFNPETAGAGTHAITYSYTDSNNCSSDDISNVTVHSNPIVSVSPSDPDFCINEGSQLFVGTPVGGSFSGSGMTSSTFNPATAGLGMHTIVYSYTDNNNCSGDASTNVVVDNCLEIKEMGENDITFYPNPTKDLLTIDLGVIHQKVNASTIDITGQEVHSEGFNEKSILTLSLQNLPVGVYFVKIKTEKIQGIIRVLKQ